MTSLPMQSITTRQLSKSAALFLCAFGLTVAFSEPSSAQTGSALRQTTTAQKKVRSIGSAEDEKLKAFFKTSWEANLKANPESASYFGDTRFNDRWTDQSLAAIDQREAADRQEMRVLKSFDRKKLSASAQLDYDTFAWLLEKNIERQKFREYLQPISHQSGVQTADGISEVMPFSKVADYENWLARMTALPTVIDQTMVLMREGLKAGSMPPKVLMQRVVGQISAQVVTEPSQSPFYRPFLKMDRQLAEQDRANLQQKAQVVIKDKIVPAFKRFQTFFNDDYLPNARLTIGASDVPNGRAYYDFLAGFYTTTNLNAEQIHTLGLSEVTRLRAAMQVVKTETGFKGSLPEFFTYLRTEPKFFFTSPEALLTAYQALTKRIDPQLVKVFKNLPRMTYGVRAIPDNIAPDTTTAYYQPGASDGSRAGQFYVNLYRPETRPKWEMVPLSLHEAVPGHHFQFARALELPDAPLFRKTAYFVAYGEGWALYAEQLGTEMGLYDDPYDRFGQLTYEMWRAVRLVVDTGIHAKGWTREQAIAFFKDNAGKTEQDIVNEIDRYIGNPAQALAYKIGQLKISQLREQASKQLGSKFDLREFNDAVLNVGSVPLGVLEQRINVWITTKQNQTIP
jgi:uncharacterized protein (DUF885 family)